MMSWPQAWWLDYVFFWLLGLNHSLPERAFIHLHFPSGDLRLCCLLLENHHFFIGESWWIIYGPWLPAAFLQAAEEEYERVHGEKPGAPSPDAAGWEMLDGWMDGSISSTVSGSMNQIDFQDLPCFFFHKEMLPSRWFLLIVFLDPTKSQKDAADDAQRTASGGFQLVMGVLPIAGWFIRKNPIKIGWFRATAIFGNVYIYYSLQWNIEVQPDIVASHLTIFDNHSH